MHEDALFERLVCLWARLSCPSPKHQLCLQPPFERNLPFLLRELVHQRVVVLQVAAKPFRFKRGPEHVLVHGRRMFGPLGELVSVEGQLGLELVDWMRVFKEQDLGVLLLD